MKTKSTLAAAALALCVTPGLRADAGHPPAADRFPIAVETIEAKRATAFAEADANGDGLVSESEFMAFEPEREHHRRPMGFHGGPSGMPPGGPVDDAAREARMTAMDDAVFAALDSNGDGSLTRSEFSHEALMTARRNGMKQGMFKHLDTDGDGFLSPTEFPPSHLRALDVNGDGEISREEMHHRGGPGAP